VNEKRIHFPLAGELPAYLVDEEGYDFEAFE
jgi:hypothetical protein